MATKEEKVKGVDSVTIEYTEKSKFHKKGDTASVHRIQADKLVEKEFAKIKGEK